MHTSTLHKSAQQGAPDAYISLCKSTIQDMRAPRRYTRPSLHAPRGACIFLARVQMMPTPSPYTRAGDIRAPCLCVRPRHARATPAAYVQDMHAPLFLRAPRDGRANRRACKDACAATTRDAKMRASEQLRGVRPS